MTHAWAIVASIVERRCPHFLRPYRDQLKVSPLAMRLAKGAFWSLVGALISRGLALAASILVARILRAEHFGELGMIRSTVGMLGTLAGFGLGITASKYVAEFREKDKARAGRVVALSQVVAIGTGGLMSAIMLIFAPWLAESTLSAQHLTPHLRAGTLILLFGAMNGAETGSLAGFEDFGALAVVNFWAGLVNFTLMVAGVHFGDLDGAVWALGIGMALNWLLNSLGVRRAARHHGVTIAYHDCLSELGMLWRFSTPAALSGAMLGPVTWACSAMLAKQPGGYAQVGLYSAADQWRMMILFFPVSMSGVVLPVLSSLWSEHNQSGYYRTLWFSVKAYGISALIVALPICLFSSFIMASYGSDFRSGGSILVLVAAAAVAGAINSIIGDAISSRGRMWVKLGFDLLWAVVAIWMTRVFIADGLGAVGLALATLTAFLVRFLFQGLYIWRSVSHG